MALLGIDISTTGAKALIIDESGDPLASVTNPLTLSTPKPLWSEQDPVEWWEGVSASIRGALDESGLSGEDIAAIGLTGQMHGLVLLDEATSGLDESARDLISALAERTAGNGGSVVMVSHDRDQLRMACHRTMGLSSGRLETPA